MGVRVSRKTVVETIRFRTGEDVAEIDVAHLSGEDVRSIAKRASVKGRMDHDLHSRLLLDMAVKGWRGFEREDGSEWPFEDTPEAKQRLLDALPSVYVTTVETRAFGRVEVEYAALGNSTPSSASA